MPIDLASVIMNLQTGVYTVSRIANATYGTDGRAIPPVPKTFTIVGNVQSMTGRELRLLPEGMRTKELLTLYTATELFTQQAGNDPDTVTVDGIPYYVWKAERSKAKTGNYFKIILGKIGRQ